mgnify:CR=1 FL=1
MSCPEVRMRRGSRAPIGRQTEENAYGSGVLRGMRAFHEWKEKRCFELG